MKWRWRADYWDADKSELPCPDIVDPKENLSVGGLYYCNGKPDHHLACSGKHPFIAIIPESRYDYESKEPAPKRKPKAAPPKPQTKPVAVKKNVYYDPLAVGRRFGEMMAGVTSYACRHGSMPGEICPECGR